MLDIISVGDAALDTFAKIKDASINQIKGLRDKQLCINFGDKIPITSIHQKIAGNALNNAVGSARLGLKAGFYSIIGDDETGGQIVKKMKTEKVSLKYLRVQKNSSTNYSIVINFMGDRTQLSYSHPREYSLPTDMEPSRWIYYTAIGKKHNELEKQLLRYAAKYHTKIAFNPGTIHLKEGVKGSMDILRHTEIIFLNKEEAETWVGNSVTVPDLLYRLHELGPHIAVITDGKNGAYASNSVNTYYLPIFPAKVIEATGAGDSFATGFLAALFHGQAVSEAMRWGTANSASVVSRIGPQEGLLRLNEIRGALRRNEHVKTKIVSNGGPRKNTIWKKL